MITVYSDGQWHDVTEEDYNLLLEKQMIEAKRPRRSAVITINRNIKAMKAPKRMFPRGLTTASEPISGRPTVTMSMRNKMQKPSKVKYHGFVEKSFYNAATGTVDTIKFREERPEKQSWNRPK